MTGYRAITRARKIVFWISATLFVVTWPMLVLFALGIVISPTSKQPVVETGVIRAESRPAGARLFLNGKDTGKTTPTAIERLKAGTYRIELTKARYRPWRGQVTVDIQAVRRISYAILVPEVLPVHLVNLGDYSSEQLSHNSQFLILSGTTVADLRVYDLKNSRFLPDAAALAPYAQDRVVRMSLLPWGGILLLRVFHDGRSSVLVLHVGTLGIDLEHAIGVSFFQNVSFAWSPTLSGAVYFLRDHRLWKMDDWSAGSETLLARLVRSVGIINDNLYYIDSDGDFGQITPFGRSRVLFTVPESARRQLTTGATIEYAAEAWGAVLTPDGTLYLFRARGFSEYHGIRGVAADRSRNRFVVWSDTRVGSLPFPSSKKDTRAAIEWAPPPPTNRKISAVTPAADLSNCLFTSDGTVWIEPVIPGVVGAAQRVETLAPGERYLYSEASGQLLISDPVTGRMRVGRFIPRSLLPSLE